jgi:hypothetical protein
MKKALVSAWLIAAIALFIARCAVSRRIYS